ncbi:hypothetical protein E2562_031797 [Oryza meyeriana var. granulata]|uniref:Uncharacterized protein n=1 Tax=Oryza meyeriana var. granulata TaxID=110450 RepID=A0A6G1EED7_9ORYZ|nr:hypothetical protein E2562_031797 [Oryza meyeriana var. granulata]
MTVGDFFYRRFVEVTKFRNKNDNTTTLHHYKADVFSVAIDQQLIELEDRFDSQATNLLALCVSLDPRLDSFDMEKILASPLRGAAAAAWGRGELPMVNGRIGRACKFGNPRWSECAGVGAIWRGGIKAGESKKASRPAVSLRSQSFSREAGR